MLASPRLRLEDEFAVGAADGMIRTLFPTAGWYELLAQAGGTVTDAYPCPCCGFLTLAQEPPGTYAVCPVCWWEDDDALFRDPSYSGGANAVSLRQARSNFSATGASDERFLSLVRRPTADEEPPNG